MEAIRSSETSVLIRATRRHLPEDDNHHSHRRGNLKSYIYLVKLLLFLNYVDFELSFAIFFLRTKRIFITFLKLSYEDGQSCICRYDERHKIVVPILM
jgi:hypothetical protein